MLNNIHDLKLQFRKNIKHIGIKNFFKKFCLIIKTYNNFNKNIILTLS